MNKEIPEPRYDGFSVDLARVGGIPKIKLARGFILTLDAQFDYETTYGHQGLGGYYINGEFIEKFIKLFGGKELADCHGALWVEHTDSEIARLIPLGKNKNEREFDIREWSAKLQPQDSSN